MSVFRLLCLLALGALPTLGATFGTVVAHAQPLADLALDEGRRRLYVVNTASNQVEVYSTNTSPPRLTATVKTSATPLAAAMSRSGRYLYVACYSASTLDIIDLNSSSFSSRSVTLSASPEAVAVGFNEKVLISTIGTGTGQNVLTTFDPNIDASRALQSVVIAPPAPSAPQLPPPNGVMALASHARLVASQDGRTIIGVHELANNTRTVFVFDVNSSIVVGSRNLGVISPVLAVSPDASQFITGPMVLETSSLLILGQQNAVNSPFAFPAGSNFNTQTSQGGAMYAQGPTGLTLITAYNMVPVIPGARPNSSQLLMNDPGNLMIQLGIQLPETLSGKMVSTTDTSTVYAISQSGFIVLPLGTLTQLPLAVPDSNVALVASDQCGVTASLNSAVIPVRNAGARTLTVSAQPLTVSTTAVTTRTTPRPYGADLTVQFNPSASRNLGTATPDQLIISSPEAVNIPPNIRVFQNYRNTEARGDIVPIDIGATTTGLSDMLSDPVRRRLYIANPGRNRIEVFDTQKQQLLAPIAVGQLPRSMAFGQDTNTLYVANSGSEMVSIVDVNKGAVVGRVSMPPLPFNASFGPITPVVMASTQRGPQVVMSDGTLWRIAGNTLVPRTFNPNIFGTARNVPSPQTMASTPEGSFMLLLAGSGNGFLYDAAADDFVSVRQVMPVPIAGYFGPISAGPNGQYYLVGDQVLNAALTSVGSGTGTGPIPGGGLPLPSGPTVTSRPVYAVAAAGPQSFARFSVPLRLSTTATASDAGLVEVVNAQTQQTTAAAQALEGPLAVATGTARVNVSGRMMAMDAQANTAYVLTTSGISIIPLVTSANATVPQLSAVPVTNTANFTTAVAPGGLISILGKNLASPASATAGTTLPTILGGTCVTVNNSPVPLLATSPTQINAQLPPTLTAGRYPIVVRSITAQAASSAATVTVSKYAPAIFLDPEGPAIFHKDGQRVNKSHPATRDEPLTIYATGLGVTTGGKVSAGTPAPSSPAALTAPVQLFFGNPTISNSGVIVDWSGLAPGLIGTYMIKCRVPGNHLKGDALPVTLRIGGVNSATTGPAAALVYVN